MSHPPACRLRRRWLVHSLGLGLGTGIGLSAAAPDGRPGGAGGAITQGPALAEAPADVGSDATVEAAAAHGRRAIALSHLHTRERIDTVFAIGEHFVPVALRALDHFLRDHYTGDVGRMDPRLYELLQRLRRELGSRAAFEIISGYRSPVTNEQLRRTRGGGVARRSLHMEGRAVDVRLPGVPLVDLRDAALALKLGGVGHYPQEGFVHLDTGPFRRW